MVSEREFRAWRRQSSVLSTACILRTDILRRDRGKLVRRERFYILFLVRARRHRGLFLVERVVRRTIIPVRCIDLSDDALPREPDLQRISLCGVCGVWGVAFLFSLCHTGLPTRESDR